MDKKHIKLILVATALYIGVILIQRLGTFVATLVTNDSVLIKLSENFAGTVFVVVAISMMRMWQHIYWISAEALKKWYLFLLPAAYIFINFGDFYPHSTFHIGAAFLSTLFTGTMEELLCRGLVLAIFIKGYEQLGMSNHLLKAVLMSSLLFGLAHLANAVGYGHATGAVIGQVFFATFIAVGFCAVYLHTRSILPLIFIHAGINFVSFLSDAPDAVKTDTFISTLPAIIVCAPLFVYGFILMNKKQQSDLSLAIK